MLLSLKTKSKIKRMYSCFTIVSLSYSHRSQDLIKLNFERVFLISAKFPLFKFPLLKLASRESK
jgi:hypothetical protein